MRRRWCITTSFRSMAVAVLIAGPSLAQTTLPPVVVTAPPGGSAGGSLELQRASSAGSRLGLKLQEQPAAVEIVPGVEVWPRTWRIEMVLGRPAYIVQPWEGPWRTVFADDGAVLRHVEPARAVDAAQQFSRTARARYLGQIERDQWTVPNSLNHYRPLHHIALADAAGTEVYLSDRTGEIMRDTTRRERFWNWCGAVLHWVYFTELRQDRELWRQVVLWIAGIGMVSTFTGVVVGLVRWRPRARYRSGSTSPYYGMMCWHHVLGLAAALPLCTWMVSGWLSLNPGYWVSDSGLDHVAHERYTARDRAFASFTITPAIAWQAAPMSPPAKEVRLQFWDGKPLYVFAASPEQRRLISGHESPIAATIGDTAAVADAARRLLPDARLRRIALAVTLLHPPRPLSPQRCPTTLALAGK